MRREHRLQIRNGALDLNDEQHALYRVAGEDVDGLALAVNGKGDLSPYLPVPVDQQPCSRLDRRGMRTIEQPVERASPFQRRRRSRVAPSASVAAVKGRSDRPRIWPSSSREIAACETPDAAARSCWRQPRRRRRARIWRPMRTVSIAAR